MTTNPQHHQSGKIPNATTTPIGWRVVLLTLVAASLIWTIYAIRRPLVPSPLSDGWDYAQLGKCIAGGDLFATHFTYPIMLGIDPAPPFQTYWRLPLYPLLCAIPCLAMEQPPISVFIVLSGLFYILGAVVYLYLLRSYLRSTALFIALGFYLLSPHLLSSSFEALSEPFYITLLLAAFVMLFKNSHKSDFLAGVLLGLSWLTRSNTLFFLPALAVWFLMGEGSWRKRFGRLAFAGAGIALVCLPWWMRNYFLTGSPTFNMSAQLPRMFTEEWPGWTLFRTVPGGASELPPLPLPALILKTIENLWKFAVVQRLLSCNPLIVLAALGGFVLAWKQRVVKPQLWRMAVMLIVWDITTMLALCAIEPVIRLYAPLLPLIYLFAAYTLSPDTIKSLFQKHATKRNRAVLYAIVALSVLAYAGRFWIRRPAESWSRLTRQEIQQAQTRLPGRGIVISDTPDYLAWTLQRDIIFLPTLESFPRLFEAEREVTVLHLSPALEKLLHEEGKAEQRWLNLGQSEKPPWLGPLLMETSTGHRFYRISKKEF